MDPREQRGLVIAATQRLVQRGKVWLVPSQGGGGKKYTVHLDPTTPFCSCPDHEDTGGKCKHMFAVEYTIAREHRGDGEVVETKTITLTEKRTYRQDWPLYNLAQCEEKRRFMVLLHDLCKGLPDPPANKTGRKRTAMADMVFTAVFKVYSTFSSRRFGSDLDDAFDKGFISHKLHPGMSWRFLENPLLTPVLPELVVRTSLPLKAVETTFAPDSTGFSTSRFVRWFDEKYGAVRSGRDWVKAHCMCGVKTHVITAVEILDKDAADSPQFKPLVEKTAENFTVKEVTADKAYLSKDNLELVAELGGLPFIPFKVNSVPGEAGTVWEKLFHFYSMNRERFMAKYHQRSNAESVFSMVKGKFRDHVRSKTDVAMKNEVLCKIIAHNICCLIMSQLELGIEPLFWGEEPAAEGAAPIAEPEVEAVAVTHAAPPVAVEKEPSVASCQSIQVGWSAA
jgi:transposase